MNRHVAMLAVLGVPVAVPVQAASAHHAPPPYGIKPPRPIHCNAEVKGFDAFGSLVAAHLTPAAHHRYSGTVEVNVTRANHHGATGDETFTLTGARVIFHHGVSPAAPAAGSRVHVVGLITVPSSRCTSAHAPTVLVRKVDIRQPVLRHARHHR